MQRNSACHWTIVPLSTISQKKRIKFRIHWRLFELCLSGLPLLYDWLTYIVVNNLLTAPSDLLYLKLTAKKLFDFMMIFHPNFINWNSYSRSYTTCIGSSVPYDACTPAFRGPCAAYKFYRNGINIVPLYSCYPKKENIYFFSQQQGKSLSSKPTMLEQDYWGVPYV